MPRLPFILSILLFPGPALAQDDRFEKHVRPILKQHCERCHGDKKLNGGLDVRTKEAILVGGQTGKVLTPGDPKRSLILQMVSPQGDPHMPPNGQLTKAEIAEITQWIATLKPTGSTPGREHWAFRKLTRPAPPSVRQSDWVRTPVDAFILARLEEKRWMPSPSADRIDLVRRVTFDLIGLPPTPEEINSACADASDEWYAKVVDRLLASPHYGERWGRHWLDLARHADSGGFHSDLDRPNAWRYRDYVIRSFNADKPFPQFVREQLAGDEIDPANPDCLTATGFCVAGPSNDDNMGQKTEKYRLEQLDDLLSTTGSVFLGLTIGCARCHDHKYDPLPQEDYYRFLAIFNSSERREVPLNAGKIDLAQAKAIGRKGPMKDAGITFLTDSQLRTTHLFWRGNHETSGPEVHPGVPTALAFAPAVFAPPKAGAPTRWRTTLAD